jgi:hypothetical protein|tara:strand:+ start:419 stop:607 length:189 start_codon:yes stop_codon:yes gene_type:complete
MKEMTIDDLTTTVRELQDEVKAIKEINKVLMDKLGKAYEDRIVLRNKLSNVKKNQEREVLNA